MMGAVAGDFHDANVGFAVVVLQKFHIAFSSLAAIIRKSSQRKQCTMQTHHSMAELNDLSPAEFTRVIGPVFEHSPWIAERTAPQRPFTRMDDLHRALCGTVRNASEDEKLNLIRAHPDLVGRAALAGTLTSASQREQAAAGLNKLSPEEIALFQQQNAAYRARFGFPFIICARQSKKEAILAGFAQRLQNSPEQEIETALEEIFKIASLRLRDIILE
jgi:OHCU decarboxylase